MPTTTVASDTDYIRPPFGARVFWPTTTYPLDFARGTVLDPATPDVGPGPVGTIPVLSGDTVCHVATAILRRFPAVAAPAA